MDHGRCLHPGALSPPGQFSFSLHLPTVGLTKMTDPGPFLLPRFPKTGPAAGKSKGSCTDQTWASTLLSTDCHSLKGSKVEGVEASALLHSLFSLRLKITTLQDLSFAFRPIMCLYPHLSSVQGLSSLYGVFLLKRNDFETGVWSKALCAAFCVELTGLILLFRSQWGVQWSHQLHYRLRAKPRRALDRWLAVLGIGSVPSPRPRQGTSCGTEIVVLGQES